MQAARPDSGHGRGGGGSQLHGAGADSGHAESAEAGRPDDRSDRPGGAERGVRGAGDRLYPRAQARPGEGQHLRRRDRPRPPARRHGCEDFDDSRTRLTPYEVPLRFMRHVYRGRSRHLHARGARLMAAYDRVLVETAGGGANLALACDYRIASDQASIGQVFHQLGLVPDWGGSFFLPRLVGTSKALELVWSARMVSAVEALVLGLFDRVVPHAQLATEARRLAELWAGQPPGAVRRAKEALYASEVRSLAAMLDWEIAQQNELFASPEARERLAGGASLAKRSR